jgi:hypothetical protein
MYRGFNLKIDRNFLSSIKSNRFLSLKETSGLDFSPILKKGTLDGNEIIKKWFPNDIRYHIFLSHSHKDEDLALRIAYILEERHNLKVFVDSDIWGNSIELLKGINYRNCIVGKYKDKTLYDYDKCNYSASHVYLMLMNSLNIMIDRCEALFFLNTPNSISLEDNLDNLDDLDRTLSPWIFSEIQTSKIIRKKIPNRNIPLMESTKCFSTDLKISYPLELDHLTEMSQDVFFKWIYSDYDNPNKALDGLYEIYPLEKHSNINRF